MVVTNSFHNHKQRDWILDFQPYLKSFSKQVIISDLANRAQICWLVAICDIIRSIEWEFQVKNNSKLMNTSFFVKITPVSIYELCIEWYQMGQVGFN